MFYKVLFVLTLYSLYRAGKSFLRESVVFTDGKCSFKSNYALAAGTETYLYLKCQDRDFIARVSPRSTTKVGDIIKIALETPKIHLFDKDTELTITN